MGEYLETFSQKLGNIDRIAQRILKEQSGIRLPAHHRACRGDGCGSNCVDNGGSCGTCSGIKAPPLFTSRVPDRAAGVRHRLLQLGRVRGGAAAPPGGHGWLRGDVLSGVGGPEREHESGLPARSPRVRPLHRVHEGELWSLAHALASDPEHTCHDPATSP